MNFILKEEYEKYQRFYSHKVVRFEILIGYWVHI